MILTATCFISDPAQIPAIAAWLKGSGTVTFANRTGGYYKARIANQIPFEKVLRGNPHCTFAVNFRCYPFFYADAGDDISITTSGTIVTNPGSVYSEPILTVTGSGNITLMSARPSWNWRTCPGASLLTPCCRKPIRAPL